MGDLLKFFNICKYNNEHEDNNIYNYKNNSNTNNNSNRGGAMRNNFQLDHNPDYKRSNNNNNNDNNNNNNDIIRHFNLNYERFHSLGYKSVGSEPMTEPIFIVNYVGVNKKWFCKESSNVYITRYTSYSCPQIYENQVRDKELNLGSHIIIPLKIKLQGTNLKEKLIYVINIVCLDENNIFSIDKFKSGLTNSLNDAPEVKIIHIFQSERCNWKKNLNKILLKVIVFIYTLFKFK